MKKSEVIELVQKKYGITADRKKRYHPNILEAFIEIAYNNIIGELARLSISKNDYASLDQFVKSYYNVPVLCDQPRNEWYSELPAAIIQLPMNRGVKSVSLMQDRKTSFMFRENSTSEIMENLEFALINQTPTFYVENSKVFYDERMTSEVAQAGVLMKLIITFREFDDDDTLPIPSGLSLIAEVENLINQTDQEDQKPNAKSDDTNIGQQ